MGIHLIKYQLKLKIKNQIQIIMI